MVTVLGIDSGADCGWALVHVESRQLISCGLGRLPSALQDLGISRVVIERPHAGQTRARKKDVITLAIRAGEVGGICRYLLKIEPEYIEPNRWKGSVSKKIMNDRVEAKLSSSEVVIYESAKVVKSKRHNMLDAIGISLFCVGR
jgi:hypothetical protein